MKSSIKSGFYLLTSIFLFAFSDLQSQTLKNIRFHDEIDSVNILPVIGSINSYNGKGVVPDDSLSMKFVQELTTIIPGTTNIRLHCMGSEYSLPDSLVEYFVSTIPRFKNLTPETFSRIPLGKSFSAMLADKPGRYFGIIFYQGFEQRRVAHQMLKEAAVTAAMALLTGRLYVGVSAPEKPYIISDILIIDKTNNAFVFYQRCLTLGSPMSSNHILVHFKKSFDEFR